MNSITTITIFVLSVVCLCAFVNGSYDQSSKKPSSTPAPSSTQAPSKGNLLDLSVMINLIIRVLVTTAKNAVKTCGDVVKGAGNSGQGALIGLQATIQLVLDLSVNLSSLLGNVLGNNGLLSNVGSVGSVVGK